MKKICCICHSFSHSSRTRYYCIRRAELPEGISAHKPTRKSSNETNTGKRDGSGTPVYPNAHFGIVFGSDDGCEQVDRPDVPGLNRYDIRRYMSQKVILQNESMPAISKLCRVPPTIESYAIPQPLATTPFSVQPDPTRKRYVPRMESTMCCSWMG